MDRTKPAVITRRTAVRVIAGAGAAGAAAGVGGYLLSRDPDPLPARPELRGLAALTPAEGALVEAIGARIWPGDPADPGAREAGSVHYVDRALAGPYARYLSTYRIALGQIDAAARKLHRKPFVELEESTQDALLDALSRGRLAGVRHGESFFLTIRVHVLEGVFSDPVHGGNRNLVGWKAVGYPGPFYGITEQEQRRFAEHQMPYRRLADL